VGVDLRYLLVQLRCEVSSKMSWHFTDGETLNPSSDSDSVVQLNPTPYGRAGYEPYDLTPDPDTSVVGVRVDPLTQTLKPRIRVEVSGSFRVEVSGSGVRVSVNSSGP